MTVLRVNDRSRYYQYLVDYKDGKLILYWPDYNSIAFGKAPHFILDVGYWNRSKYKAFASKEVTIDGVLACAPFRYERNFYRQYSEWEINLSDGSYVPNYVYIALQPVTDDLAPDREMEGCQGMLSIREELGDTFNITIDGVDNSGNFVVSMHGQSNVASIKQYIIEQYCPSASPSDINISYEIALVSEDDIFYHYDSDSMVKVTYKYMVKVKDEDGNEREEWRNATTQEKIKPQPTISSNKLYIPILTDPYVEEDTATIKDKTYYPNYTWLHMSNGTFVEGLSLVAIVKVSISRGDINMNIDFKSPAKALTMEMLGEIIASM